MPSEIHKIIIADKEYPSLLKKIEDPPQTLYFRGNISCLKENCFAIVGTRRYSAYGKEIAFSIANDLAEAGLVIVSGLAPGIDTFAHLSTVERGKKTIAVLGTGLDEESVYPQTNLGLAKRIVETNGCLVSEYPPGSHGSKLTFPARNRIVSGLSLGILVVEAKYKSGALITAANARKQKRKLFAVPGDIHSLNSQGPHLLIKKGAILTENADDILKELGFFQKKKCLIQKENIGDSSEESRVLAALSERPLEINQIIEKTKLPTARVISCLTVLEIKGKVKNLGGSNYALTR